MCGSIKPGRDECARRVDHGLAAAFGRQALANLGDQSVAHADVARAARRAGAVDDRSPAHEHVTHVRFLDPIDPIRLRPPIFARSGRVAAEAGVHDSGTGEG